MAKSLKQTAYSRHRPAYPTYRPYGCYVPIAPLHTRSDSEEVELLLEQDLRTHDLGPAQIRLALNELDVWNTIYRQVPTWDKGLRGWIGWQFPQRILQHGQKKLLAPGSWYKFDNITMPVCPHFQNDFRTLDDCTMQLYRAKVSGKEQYVVSARQHQCPIKIIVPRVGKSQKSTYTQARDDDSDSDSDLYSAPPASQPSSSSSPASKSASSLSSTSSGPVTRSTTQRNTITNGSHTDPIIIDGVLGHVEALNDVLDLAVKAGNAAHCDTNRNSRPECLRPYHPDSQLEPFEHMEFDNSVITQAFRTRNSQRGITKEEFFLLVTATNFCVGCRSYFSFDGFRAHTVNGGICGSPKYKSSGLPFVAEVPFHPAADSDDPPIELSHYFSMFNPPRDNKFCASMVGQALIEWNSVVGISLEAWVTVITARCCCTTCARICSLDGDSAHRDVHGNCSSGGKGKGCTIGF